MDIMGMKIGPNHYNLCLEMDTQHIKFSENSPSEAAKEARISLKALKNENKRNLDRLFSKFNYIFKTIFSTEVRRIFLTSCIVFWL